MANRKVKDRKIRKLMKSGSTSLVVSIPVDILKNLKWVEKQKVIVKQEGKKVVIKDWPARNA